MTDTKKILRKLLSDHVGEQNAITQAQLSEATGVNTSTLRSELRRLREERNIPIANQRDGYYIISTKVELQDYIGHINQEIKSKKQTIEHTLEAWDEFDESEIEIEPNDEPDVVEQTYPCAGCGIDVPKSDVYYPDSGELEDKPACKKCYGENLMERNT